jgi:hypothetical protein
VRGTTTSCDDGFGTNHQRPDSGLSAVNSPAATAITFEIWVSRVHALQGASQRLTRHFGGKIVSVEAASATAPGSHMTRNVTDGGRGSEVVGTTDAGPCLHL